MLDSLRHEGNKALKEESMKSYPLLPDMPALAGLSMILSIPAVAQTYTATVTEPLPTRTGRSPKREGDGNPSGH
jgi:hypothetical protein